MTSFLGANLFNLVGVLWLVEVANSASMVGVLLLIGGLPVAICAPLGGVIADRYSRRNTIVWVDVCSGL